MIWDTSIWRLGCSNRSKIRSAQKCYLCLRYVVSPMCPGRTQNVWGGRWDLNPRHSEPQSDALPAELLPPFAELLQFTLISAHRKVAGKGSSWIALRMGIQANPTRETLSPRRRRSPLQAGTRTATNRARLARLNGQDKRSRG